MTQPHRRSLRAPLLAAAIAVAFAAPFAMTGSTTVQAKGNAPAARADTDRFIVKFKPGSVERGNSARRQQHLDAVGRKMGLRIGQLRRLALGADVIHTDRLLTDADAKALVGLLRADPRVEYAEVDARMTAQFTPDDTYYAAYQWHYWDATGGINAPAAWDVATGANEVVAVVDTGIRTHIDLDANILPGYDMITDTTVSVDGDGRDADPSDPGDWYSAGECGKPTGSNSSWHGTHVAGTIAAVTNNARGMAGVAYNSKVVPVRVLGKCGGYVSDIADGILWAAGATVGSAPVNANPADVINMSLGGTGACGATYQAAIDAVVASGTVVVVSAGNSNADTVGYRPANCDGVITVAATGRTGGRASYSNYGSKVEIAAPGGDGTQYVYSTLNAGTTTPGAANYAGYQGTSMAAPHVSGVVALVKEASGDTLAPADITALLQATSRTLPIACAQGCGSGIVDAGAAATAATSPVLLFTSAASVTEGDAGDKVVSFTVKLSQAIASDVTFDFATADGTATAGEDYDAVNLPGQVIAAGDTSKTFDVTVHGDADFEFGETFTANLDNIVGITALQDTGTGTIVNDDVLHLQNAVPVAGLEDAITNDDLRFTLPVPANASNLKFQIAGGTGDADMFVRFGAEPTQVDFDCRPYLNGNNETCNVTAQEGTWYGMLNTYAPFAGITLTGSYEVPVDISVDDVGYVEGAAGTQVKQFVVTLSQATAVATTVDVATADDTAVAGSDYAANAQTGLTIPAGSTFATFDVPVLGDTDIEADETFFVNLSNPSANGTLTDGQAVGTITNDDYPSLSIDDASSNEGDSGTQPHTFTVSLSQASYFPVTFDIGTSGGSATADDDFAAHSETGVTIAAGDTSATFTVDVNGDTALEGDETYTVDVTSVGGASIADSSGTGTIVNDDYPSISISDASAVVEGNAGTKTMTFTVSLSAASAFPVQFDASTYDGSAVAGSDYVATTVSDVIPAGQLATTFSVTINGDQAMERNEVLYAGLSNVVGATAGDVLGQGTITNDDGTISVADPVAIFEGDTGTKMMNFVVSLSQASTADVSFNARTHPIDDTATPNVDFQEVNLTGLVIPAGQLSMVVSVPVIGDTAIEADETIRLNLGSGSAIVDDGKAYGVIRNDDGAGKLTIADAGFVEGDSGTKTLNFTVTLSSAMATPVTFNLFTVNGMALAGEDYTARSLTGVTIPAGETKYTFSLTTFGDTKVEGNETLFVRISNASVPVLDGQARGMLINDDGAVLSIGDAQVTEGDSGTRLMTFTVSLSRLATAKVTFNFATAADTATAGSDFDPVSVTGLVIPYGQLSRTVSVVVRGDTSVEPDEVLRGNISMGNVSIVDGIGMGTIVNDDPAP